MSLSILLLDNFDSFTHNLADYFCRCGAQVRVQRNDCTVAQLQRYDFDMLVLSPGPDVPSQAGCMMEAIAAFKQTHPIFGVCLGMQALIEAFGGTIKKINPRHGKSEWIEHKGEGMFANIANPMEVGRYHSWAAAQVPEAFEKVAHARSDAALMAIQHRHLPLSGVQFHPESVLSQKDGAGLQLIRNIINQNYEYPKVPL
ncbi:MAG: aminodeoxychorismate/anthranilate synthase component II [Sphingobacteriales bacterium]|nr:aminodeoxychorismate/anthranilate synthase component II [Sphingobacteriales bacterium]